MRFLISSQYSTPIRARGWWTRDVGNASSASSRPPLPENKTISVQMGVNESARAILHKLTSLPANRDRPNKPRAFDEHLPNNKAVSAGFSIATYRRTALGSDWTRVYYVTVRPGLVSSLIGPESRPKDEPALVFNHCPAMASGRSRRHKSSSTALLIRRCWLRHNSYHREVKATWLLDQLTVVLAPRHRAL